MDEDFVRALVSQMDASSKEMEQMLDSWDSDETEEAGDIPILRVPLVGVVKAELTINNGEQDLTFRIARYRRDKDKKLPPELFWVDVRSPGARYGYLPVAMIRCTYTKGDGFVPEYEFVLRNTHMAVKDPVVMYAAHLTYLMLSGVRFRTDAWTDCLLIEREPTDRYEFQQVTRCMRCGRKLTKPASIDQGFGPRCARGLAEQFKYDTTVVRWLKP